MIESPRPTRGPAWRAGRQYFALSGLDRMRAFVDGVYPPPPAYRLAGMRAQRIDRGSVTYTLAGSGWLAGRDGFVAPGAIAYFMDAPVTNPVHSVIPGGASIRTVRLSIDFQAPMPASAGPFLGEGTMLGGSGGVGLGQAVLRAADGTEMASSTCRTVILDDVGSLPPEGDPPDEPLVAPEDVAAPDYDPPGDESGLAYLERSVDNGDRSPFWALLDCHVSEAEHGRVVLAMPASHWLSTHVGILYGGVTASLGTTAAEAAMWSADAKGERTRMLSYTHDFNRMAHPGEQSVIAEARLVHRGRTMAVADVELLDSEGRRVGLGRATGLVGTVGP